MSHLRNFITRFYYHFASFPCHWKHFHQFNATEKRNWQFCSKEAHWVILYSMILAATFEDEQATIIIRYMSPCHTHLIGVVCLWAYIGRSRHQNCKFSRSGKSNMSIKYPLPQRAKFLPKRETRCKGSENHKHSSLNQQWTAHFSWRLNVFYSAFRSFNSEMNSLTNQFEVSGCISLKVSSNWDLHKEVVSCQ